MKRWHGEKCEQNGDGCDCSYQLSVVKLECQSL